MAPTFEVAVSVGDKRFRLKTVARDEPLARVKVEGYIQELQERLAREATLHEGTIMGTLTERYATYQLHITDKGRRAFESGDSILTTVDLIILGTAWAGPALPAAVLIAVHANTAGKFVTNESLTRRIGRLFDKGLVRLVSEREQVRPSSKKKAAARA